MKADSFMITLLMRKVTLIIFGLILFVMPFSVWNVRAEEESSQTVRVGFFPCPFNIADENGHMSGYAYDYQQDIAAYTGWEYEYVEGSWPELLQMLKDGKIDLLADVSKTEERQSQMLFSSYAMGTENYCLYVSDKAKSIDEMDYSTLNGKRIGVNDGSIQQTLFEKWTETNGVSVELIPCNGDSMIVQMLEDDELDAAVAVDSYGFEHTVPMVRIGGSDFYFGINAERADLKAQLDDAMFRLLSKNRYYNEGLYQEYLNNNVSRSVSNEDLAWIQEHGAIRVGYLYDYLAYSDMNDATGELTGALKDYLMNAENCLYNVSLEFEPLAFLNAVDMREALQKGYVDCIFPVYSDRYYAEQTHVFVTDSVAGTSMIALVNNGGFNENEGNTVAIKESSTFTRLFLDENYPSWTVVEVSSDQECIDMVRREEVDCTIFSAERLDHIIQANQYDTLTAIALSKNASICFAVNRNSSNLLHILNQVIEAVPSSMMSGALTYYASAPKRITFNDLLRQNMLGVLGSITLTVVLLSILLYRSYIKGKKLAQALDEARIEKEHSRQLDAYNRELEAEANMDTLTQIGNRHYFFTQIGELLETEEMFVICYCDLDHLKYINDLYGHNEGDAYIRDFVQVIQSGIRSEDLFARIGGDEFCVILKNCTQDIAERKMHQMQLKFSHDHTCAYPRSFSCGIIEIPQSHDEIQVVDMLKIADERMYEQKKEHKKLFDHAIKGNGSRYQNV